MTQRIGVLSSGGDTPGMNAAIRGVVKTARHYGMEVYGIKYGFRGLIQNQIYQLEPARVNSIIYKGGTILKTSRCPEFMTEEGLRQAVENAKKRGLTGIVVIGGDGSMRGAASLSKNGINTVALPGTIDNDLAYTDFTIGFDTAVNGVIEEMVKIRDTMVSHDRIGVVEVMGNHCGDIALYSAIASGSDVVLLPEVPWTLEEVCKKLMHRRNAGQLTSMVVVAEGAAKAGELAADIRKQTGLEAKSVVLGYTQRGGNPTMADRLLASRLAEHAVKILSRGATNRTVGTRQGNVFDMDIFDALRLRKKPNLSLYYLQTVLAE